MTEELINNIKNLINDLTVIKDLCSIEISDQNIKTIQINRIDNIISKYKISKLNLNYVNELLKEDFGGSFGLLKESSPLLAALRKYQILNNMTNNIFKSEIINELIIGHRFKSQPIVMYTERHGGPIWFDLLEIEIAFLPDNLIDIKYDRTLSKSMDEIFEPLKYEKGKFEIINISPTFISGNIEISEGKRYYFETLKKMDFLFLENKNNPNNSFVVSRQNDN